jgi:hypothetical protein
MPHLNIFDSTFDNIFKKHRLVYPVFSKPLAMILIQAIHGE